MSNPIFLKIRAVNKENEEVFTFSSSNPADGVALLLLNGTDYRTNTKLDEILSEEEICKIHITYSENSVSVSEGYEQYNPIVADTNIKDIIYKIRNFYLLKSLKLNNENNEEYFFSTISLSELLSGIQIANNQGLNIILELDDC